MSTFTPGNGKQFRIDVPLTPTDENNSVGYGPPTDSPSDQIVQVLGAQTRFMEMDAGSVQAYCLIVVHQDVERTGINTIVEMGGTITDKVRMMTTFMEAMKKNVAHHKELEARDEPQ